MAELFSGYVAIRPNQVKGHFTQICTIHTPNEIIQIPASSEDYQLNNLSIQHWLRF